MTDLNNLNPPGLDSPNLDLGRRARRLRVDTLVRLRWLAIAGQTGAVLLVRFGLGFDLPVELCLAAIAASVILNVALRLRFRPSARLDDSRASVLLGFDILQLAGLLYLTGGLGNPFALLFLAPVMISAASLTPARTLALGLLTVAAATFLVFDYMPLPWATPNGLSLPTRYVGGVWVALIVGCAFIGIYAWRVAEEARQLSDALAATELVVARELHLSQLDGLAAAAAHELGTPLATITLVVKELARLVPATGPIGEDVALLAQEVARCRAILGKLASLGVDGEGPLGTMSLGHLIEDVVAPQRGGPVTLSVLVEGEGTEPACRRNPGLVYGLGNLVENALDFAAAEVIVRARHSPGKVSVTISDDGPGFAPDVLGRVGDPYVTTRGGGRGAKSEEGAGLGLGLFIAKTLLERSGATLAPGNAPLPGHGAVVTVEWPRAMFERGVPPTAKVSALA